MLFARLITVEKTKFLEIFMNRLCVAALLALSGAAVSAESLTSAQLPADSQWYVHVNLEMMRQSPVGRRMIAEDLDEAFDDVEQELGVDLKQELEGVTVYGDIPDSGGSVAVVMHGQLSKETQESLQMAVAEKADNFTEVDYAGITYFEVDGSAHFGHRKNHGIDTDALRMVFGNGQTMVSTDTLQIHQFIDAGGQMERGDTIPDQALVILHADRALFQGGLDAGATDGNWGWDSSIMNNIEHVAGLVSDDGDGGLRLEASIQASSDANAAYVYNIIQGLVSLAALDSGDRPEIAEIMQSLQINHSGNAVTLDALVPAAFLEEHIDF